MSSSFLSKAMLKCGKRMKKEAPVFPKEEAGNLSELGFDLQLDFSKFLEEARAHASEHPTLSTQQQQKQQNNTFEKPKMVKETKLKKTWKESVPFFFFFFSKSKKGKGGGGGGAPAKTKSLKGTSNNFSGPLFGNCINGSRFAHLPQRIRVSASGPLISSCFTPTMAEESEVSYRYLGHSNMGAQAFGPIYLVT